MKYEIKGEGLPVVECTLETNESMWCEGGAMSWMSANMEMSTEGGGLGGAIGKLFSGERIFHNVYTARNRPGTIAFASSFPGNILAVEIRRGREIICQKSAFLSATMGVKMEVFFQKKLGAGLFGGEGFIMQRISGTGLVFLEIDGSTVEKDLAPGEKIILDTGHLAIMDATCTMDIVSVKGIKNVLLGSEGLFNTVVTGPGHVILQTMPACSLANILRPFFPVNNN